MELDINTDNLKTIVDALLKKGKTSEEIQQCLVNSGATAEEAAAITQTAKAAYYARQRKIGMPLIAIGVAMCFSGFLIAFFASGQGVPFYIGLYGLTGIGSTVMFAGLMYVLG